MCSGPLKLTSLSSISTLTSVLAVQVNIQSALGQKGQNAHGEGPVRRESHPHVNVVTYCFRYVTARLEKQDGKGVRGRRTKTDEEAKAEK